MMHGHNMRSSRTLHPPFYYPDSYWAIEIGSGGFFWSCNIYLTGIETQSHHRRISYYMYHIAVVGIWNVACGRD